MQAAINKLTISYFQSTEEYFWKWAEGGQIIEWSNGQTLCYWKDVLVVLKELAPSGLPPFSAVLLGTAMCQDNWKKGNGKDALDIVLNEAVFINRSSLIKQERKHLKRLLSMAAVVASIDKPLRNGAYRSFLLKECFRNTTLKIQQPIASQIIDKFESGVLDQQIFNADRLECFTRLNRDLKCFYPVGIVFYDKNELEHFLKTGLDTVPEPLVLELPQEDEGEVLEALMEDERTMGIAKLTKRLIAAINIPMQTQGVSDQSYGGISDITNRGNFDKLLLSELANDNDTLTARLVNNEALYYHHEEPPAPLNRDRVLLVDTTLRMWGLPRVFALSAALACAKTQKKEVQVTAYAIDSQAETKIDLSNKKGVLHAMGLLDGGMDCMATLLNFLNKKQSISKDEEVVLISNEKLLSHPKYLANSEEIQQQLRYVITVDRSGALRFYQCISGRRKLLSSPVFDLDILLNKKKGVAGKSHLGLPFQSKETPAFLLEKSTPLLLPSTYSQIVKNQVLAIRKEKGAIVSEWEVLEVLLINEQMRLLYWSSSKKGAVELLACIEKGSYVLEIDTDTCWVVVKKTKPEPLTKIYIFSKDGLNFQSLDLTGYSVNYGVSYGKKYYFLNSSDNQYYSVNQDLSLHKVLEGDKITLIRSAYHERSHRRTGFKGIKSFINNGYSVLQRVSYMSVQREGILNIGKYTLDIKEGAGSFKFLRFFKSKKHTPSIDIFKPIQKEFIHNASSEEEQKMPNYKRFVWENGSRIILDRRGLLHLKSYNKNLPEVTIVLVLEKPIACWASDGTVCGNTYFIPYIPIRNIGVQAFNEKYLIPLLKSFIVPK